MPVFVFLQAMFIVLAHVKACWVLEAPAAVCVGPWALAGSSAHALAKAWQKELLEQAGWQLQSGGL